MTKRRWPVRQWQFFVDLFSTREQATSIALVRIAVGMTVLYALSLAALEGTVSTFWIDAEHGGFSEIRGNWWTRDIGAGHPAVTWSLYGITFGSAALLVLGVGARAAALVCNLGYAALVTSQGDTSGGGDTLTTNILWLLVLSDSGATLSLWERLRRGKWTSERLVSAWPRYLMIFQLIVVYWAAGIQKTPTHWGPGGGYLALHYVFQDPTWIRFAPDAFYSISPLTRIGTMVTWHWEQFTPLLGLIYYFRATAHKVQGKARRLRRWLMRFDLRLGWVAVGVGLHLGILLTLNVGAFSLISMSTYFALFTPDENRRFGRWLASKLRRG